MPSVDPPPALAVITNAPPLVDPVFISDLHLGPTSPRTVERFLRFMRQDAPRHSELVILGDLFEFWIGDDTADAAAGVIAALAGATAGGQRVALMHGNRDPLLGREFAKACSAELLADPFVVDVAGTPTLLSHGDAWCTRDVAHQQFRALIWQPEFQREFLAKPIAERITLAQRLRAKSLTENATKAADIMDVTSDAVVAAMKAASVRRAIHGHTHRPGSYVLDVEGEVAERWVLPDWDFDNGETRGGYLDVIGGQPRLILFDD